MKRKDYFKKLTKQQLDILIGLILGDLNINEVTKGKTARLFFEQAIQHKDYLFHLFDKFKDFCKQEQPTLKEKKDTTSYFFGTRVFAEFKELYDKFYPNGKKTIPDNIKELLTPIGLAYWYMDDGSLKSKDSKGVYLHTHGLPLEQVELLCDVLNKKFELLAKPVPKKNKKGEIKYAIYISGESYEKLRELIYPYLHPSMYYKFPLPRKTKESAEKE